MVLLRSFVFICLACVCGMYLHPTLLNRQSRSLSKKLIYKLKESIMVKNNVTYILLWTQMRSGSRFTAELISLNFDVFYVEEPVRDLFHYAPESNKRINISTFLKDIMNCKDYLYPEYLKRNMEFARSYNKDLHIMVRKGILPIEEVSKFDSAICKSSKYRLGRVVLPTLNSVKDLFEDPELDIRLILLFRDPRAIFNSINQLNQVRKVAKTRLQDNICEKQRTDLLWADKLSVKHSEKIFLLRYEDLAQNATLVTKILYSFLGFSFTKMTRNFIEAHTHLDIEETFPYSTFRRSSNRIYNWTRHLNYDKIEMIQERCRDVMKKLNYNIFKSKLEYEKFTTSNGLVL